MKTLTYSAITPAHDEAGNLPRLAACMTSQSVEPVEWIIVDNSSTDHTAKVAAEIQSRLEWARVVTVPLAQSPARGGPVVLAFEAGVDALRGPTDIVTKLDADTSFGPDFFERLLEAFAADERLGIAGGTCYELASDGTWRAERVTRGHVRGATRAYRLSCLLDVQPLEKRMGWDGIDELTAQVRGWRTKTVPGLAFRHHRELGARERTWDKWVGQGDMAHFMGYRFGYLCARTVYRAVEEPQAVGMLWGYISAAVRRGEQQANEDVRAHLRAQQGLLALPRRIGEALGYTGVRLARPRKREQ